ncbi:MAG: hypothetical protein HY094_10510 [Candidatus Melainabacteria bacterium]|nr:hypothetical protein [Candidatus Melainabacteria bacterium]
MKDKNKIKDEYINDEDLKRYIDLSPEKKLEYLNEMNQFLNAAMPPENKKIAQKLREEGF